MQISTWASQQSWFRPPLSSPTVGVASFTTKTKNPKKSSSNTSFYPKLPNPTPNFPIPPHIPHCNGQPPPPQVGLQLPV